MRRLLHAAILYASALPWAIGVAGFALALRLTVAAHRVWPDADRGNCWSFAGPRWHEQGGYLLVRWADGGVPVPHVAHVHRLPEEGVELRQFVPVRRRRGWRGLAASFYFTGRVTHVERPHPSDWTPL